MQIATLAGLLRQQSGVGDSLPIDVDAIVEWCQITFAEVPVNGFLGLFIPDPVPGILIKSGQPPGQRRFTIGHELGHFSIPTHTRQAGHWCLESDLGVPSDVVSTTIEREANKFAVELLMPRHIFKRDIDRLDLSFQTVVELACPNRYNVSRTACAMRLVELSREPCALVCTRNGKVVWRIWSDNFYYSLPGVGQSIHADTCAAAVTRGESPNYNVEKVPPYSWFLPRRETEEVLESTFVIPSLKQVLSLIWVLEST